MELKRYFTDTRTALDLYRARVHKVLTDYKRDMDTARAEAARYKDEQAYAEGRRAELLPVAREALEDADKRLLDAVSKALSGLRDDVYNYATRQPDRAYMDTLRDILTFNIKLSAAELAGLARRSEGSYLGLRALANVAAASGFRIVNIQTVDDMERTVAEILRRLQGPIQYSETADLGAALDAFGKAWQRNPVTGEALFETHNVTAAGLAMKRGEFAGIADLLDGLETAWSDKVIPAVDAFEPLIEAETGKELTPEAQRAEALDAMTDGMSFTSTAEPGHDLAAAVGTREAQRAEASRAVLDYYTGRHE